MRGSSYLKIGRIREFILRYGGEVKDILIKAVEEGKLEKKEAYMLTGLSENERKALIVVSSFIRDVASSRVVSYSRKVFIPLSNMCRNKCGYCGFRREPNSGGFIMEPNEVLEVSRRGVKTGCKEALFSLGEKPEEKYEYVRYFLKAKGYEKISSYLRDMCELVFKETGLLPHTNAGLLEWSELKMLREVNVSMGLMLENISERLCLRNGPHEYSPGKNPKLRLKVIEMAGQLKIPFTTGILIGIGETIRERIDSLYAIRELHEKYNHIQEVIIQGFRRKPNTPMENSQEPDIEDITYTVAIARLIMPMDVAIQSPPNLVSIDECIRLLKSGINDWGGISPVTRDFINPEKTWPNIKTLKEITENLNLQFRERLPIYPKYVFKEEFLQENFKEKIRSLIDERGYVNIHYEAS
ncbi:MAG: 7,8-didemethyl-8-hydroxy-5-deazariboflavin synthase CofG [Candidatus Methanomethylicia archaeon]